MDHHLPFLLATTASSATATTSKLSRSTEPQMKGRLRDTKGQVSWALTKGLLSRSSGCSSWGAVAGRRRCLEWSEEDRLRGGGGGGQTRDIIEGRWLWTPRDEGTAVELNEEVCLSVCPPT